MKNAKVVMIGMMCVLGLISVSVQATPVTVGYVFNTVDASGEWIDANAPAGKRPPFDTYSYEYENVNDMDGNWWVNCSTDSGYVLYRFQAPSGKSIDKIELGLFGRLIGSAHRLKCIINGVTTLDIGGTDFFHRDASLVLNTPAQTVDVKLELYNDEYPNNPDNTRLYDDEVSSGNTYAFAAHVVPEPATISLLALGAFGFIRRR